MGHGVNKHPRAPCPMPPVPMPLLAQVRTGFLAAATPVIGVGVCHDADSSTGAFLAASRFVPPRDRIAAPKPAVAATHVTAIAIIRNTVLTAGDHWNAAASTQSPM